jgi:hypothetical protein
LIIFNIKPFLGPLEMDGTVPSFINGFETYAGAMNQIIRRVPGQFFTDSSLLSGGEKVGAMVTIAAALGIALTIDLEKNGVFEAFDDKLKEFNSLNVVDLMTELHNSKSQKQEQHLIEQTLEDSFGVPTNEANVVSKVMEFVYNKFDPVGVEVEAKTQRMDEFFDLT